MNSIAVRIRIYKPSLNFHFFSISFLLNCLDGEGGGRGKGTYKVPALTLNTDNYKQMPPNLVTSLL